MATIDAKPSSPDGIDLSVVTHGTTAHAATARMGLYLSLAAAWIATCGSLYMSEVLGWIPCLWCWYQRIAMYPLAVILAAGLIMRDRNVPKYALCLAVPGALASTYHILLQKVPAFAMFEACTLGVPCSADYLNLFGFITIPMLALTAFVIVIVGSVVALRLQRDRAAAGAMEAGIVSVFSPTASVLLVVVSIVALFVLSGAITRSRQRPPTISSAVSAPALSASSATSPDASRDVAIAVYEQSCAGCHGPANAGMQLIRREYLQQHSDLEVMALIRSGRDATALDNFSGKAMPANGGRIGLSDEELLALVHYLREVKGG